MKKIVLSVLFLLFMISSFGQNMINEKNVVLKKGIYKTFEEFQRNMPSIKLKYFAKIINNKKSGNYGQLILNKFERKELGSIYGFCKDDKIYINPEFPNGTKIRKNTTFSEIEYLGKYAYYTVYESSGGGYSGGGGMTYSSSSLLQYVLDVESGKITALTKRNMRDILSDNYDLLREFNAEYNMKKVFKKYIIEYCEDVIRVNEQLDDELDDLDDL